MYGATLKNLNIQPLPTIKLHNFTAEQKMKPIDVTAIYCMCQLRTFIEGKYDVAIWIPSKCRKSNGFDVCACVGGCLIKY